MPSSIGVDSKYLLLALSIALHVQSQEPDSPQSDTSGLSQPSLSLGIGTAYASDYEGSNDYKLFPLLYVNVDNINGEKTYVRFSGTLDSNIINHPHWRFGPSLFYLSDYQDKSDNQFEEVEDDQVSLLRQTENALQTGFSLGYDFSSDPRSQYLVSVTATYDVLHGNGSVVTPRFSVVRVQSDKMVFSGSISASWASNRYMENRFGISVDDASRSGLDAYAADSGVKNFSADASITWIVNRYWTATIFSRYQQIIGDAADSPIVDDRGDSGNQLVGVLVNRRLML